MKQRFAVLSLTLAVMLVLAGVGPSLALDRQIRLEVMSAVVQIAWVGINKDQVYSVGVGSGTIISEDGLILTNCHVADPLRFGLSPDQIPDFDYLGINLTVRSDRPPQPAYLAEVVAADPYLDLAVIRITRGLDLKPVNAAKLQLPFVELGDSDQVEVGDELNIFGYPGIGGETVTFTKGVIAGFTLDAAIDGRAWIKTDATIAGGNSGGTGVDEQGLLVGVPTRAGAGGDEYVDCRVLADTNGDGRIDGRDTCIPTGGFINALRPANLARPLIEAAVRGLDYQQPLDEPIDRPAPVDKPRFSHLFFSAGVSEYDQPTSIVTSLPSGSRSLYLFFDYENMSSGLNYEMKVKINGKDSPGWALPSAPWNGDERGTWWIGWSDAEFVDGTYQLELLVDGQELAEAQIKIGGRGTNEPAFENLVLSLEATADDEPVEPGILFPAGTKRLLAFFDYKNMARNTAWAHNWSLDGEQFLAQPEKWTEGPSGSNFIELTSQKGLPPGAYRVELLINGNLAAMSNFWITGGQGDGITFESVIFAEGIDRQGRPVRAAETFDSGIGELHGFSDYRGMEDGLDSVVNWYLDGKKVIESPYTWDGGEAGSWHAYVRSNSGSLPDGEYGLELVVEGQTVLEGFTTIGQAPQPTPEPEPEPEDGVLWMGTVLDLDTQKPIPGAFFLVLVPGVTFDEFQWTDEEVFTAAETDRDGFYVLPDLLPRSECYTIIVVAEGYWMYAEDNVCLDEDTDPIVDVPVELERK